MAKCELVILFMQLEASVKNRWHLDSRVERETKRTFPDQVHSRTNINTPTTNRRKEPRLRSSEMLI